MLHSQSFARAQFSAIESQLKDTLGGDNVQRRDLLLAPGILLARDRVTFAAAQSEIQVGPVWNAAQVLSSGSRWHDLTQAKQRKLPQRPLLAYFPERTDGDTSFSHGTAQHPSSTNVVAYQKWSGSPAAGSTRTFNTLLIGHDQAQPAAALADTVQTLRCDESATLVKVGGKFLLLNPGGVAINAGGLQTDAEVLYLETSGTEVTHYSGSGASQLVFSGTTIFQGTERQARFGSTAPVITVPETMTVYTRGNAGRVVNFGVGAADHTDGQLVPVCTPPSGSVFPLGSTTVQCSATNSLGQTSTSSFTVTVVDETVLPAPWVTGDVGAVALPGDATYRSGTYHVTGSGDDIWGSADSFRFMHQSVTGDFDIRTQVTGLANTDNWAKAGLMVRENLDANARNAMMLISYGAGAQFQWRSTPGGGTNGTNTSGGVLTWLRLTRVGNLFTGYQSVDGLNWVQVATSQTITMAPTAQVGLAVTSHNNTALNTATFTNVALTSASEAGDLTWDNRASTGNWNTADANWTGSTWSNTHPNNAVFHNRNETVTLTQPITAGSLSFQAGGWQSGAHLLTLTGNPLSLTSITVNGRIEGNVDSLANANDQRLKLEQHQRVGRRKCLGGTRFHGGVRHHHLEHRRPTPCHRHQRRLGELRDGGRDLRHRGRRRELP